MVIMNYSFLLSIHLFGVVVGLGGAVLSDIMFLLSVRDGRISRKELSLLRYGGRAVWTGLAILFVTGIGLFTLNPDSYLSSHVFLAKMTSVGVLVLNGIIFHTIHIPWLERHVDNPLSYAVDFRARRLGLLVSGAISVSSWATAFLLAASDGVTLHYFELMSLYVLAFGVAVSGSLLLRDKIVPAVA